MVEIEYIDEHTLSLAKLEFSNKHVELAEEMLKEYGFEKHLSISKDKKALTFIVDRAVSHFDRQHEKDRFRIRIEKIAGDA